MATKYVSSLTGPEMDAALIDMAYHNSEAYAVGTRNGVSVGSSDVTYHNNAKYYAEQSQTSVVSAEAAAARAEAAVPAGTAGAVFFDRAQTLTTAQQEQARANIMAGGSNENLLDNAYFVGGGSQLGDGIFPINQRGQTSYAGGGTTFDRWRLSSGGSMTLAPEGVSVNGLMFQKKVFDLTVGDTYTLSRRTTDGNIVSVTGVVPSTEGWMIGNQNFGVYFRPSTKVCDIQIWGEYFLQAIKLEKGAYSTIANDAPPDYGTELRKCLRYYYRITGVTFLDLGAALAETATAWLLRFPLPVPMRVAPTTAVSGNFVLWNGSVGNACSGISTHTAVTPPTNPAYVAIKGTSTGMTVGNRYNIQARSQASAFIEFSADL